LIFSDFDFSFFRDAVIEIELPLLSNCDQEPKAIIIRFTAINRRSLSSQSPQPSNPQYARHHSTTAVVSEY
jgi:hypothetical protein